jgi:hypothetical protein
LGREERREKGGMNGFSKSGAIKDIFDEQAMRIHGLLVQARRAKP